jgi:endonuclease G
MYRLVALAAAAAFSLPAMAATGAQGFEACAQQFFQGYAPAPTQHQPGQTYSLCFDGFAVLYSGQSKTPIYSAEYLTRDRIQAARGEERTNRFYEEARLPAAARAQLRDYLHSGLDRGHMSPAGDMPTDTSMAQSFSLANMVPQAELNNRGVWAKNVEKPTRQYAQRSTDGVYVITGPIYSKPPVTIGPDQVWVPDQLFKLVYDPAKHKAWAYILPNTNDAQVTGVYSYDQLVRLTGMQLLPPGAL